MPPGPPCGRSRPPIGEDPFFARDKARGIRVPGSPSPPPIPTPAPAPIRTLERGDDRIQATSATARIQLQPKRPEGDTRGELSANIQLLDSCYRIGVAQARQ